MYVCMTEGLTGGLGIERNRKPRKGQMRKSGTGNRGKQRGEQSIGGFGSKQESLQQ